VKQAMATDSADIKRIVREYNQQLYTHKFNKLDEMDQFLKKYNYRNLPNMK
jgi:hypothetical protein